MLLKDTMSRNLEDETIQNIFIKIYKLLIKYY